MSNESTTTGYDRDSAIKAAQEALHQAYLSARNELIDPAPDAIPVESSAPRDGAAAYSDMLVISSGYIPRVSDAVQSALAGAFALQRAGVDAARAAVDSATRVTLSSYEQAAKMVSQGQELTAKAMAAGFEVAATAIFI